MKNILFALATLLLTSTALAQWAWRDGNTTVFSDQPPPPNIAPSQIIRQPAGSTRPAKPGEPGEAAKTNDKAAPAKPASSTQPKSMAEREAEFRERREKQAEQEKKAAEEAAKKQQLSQECERSRSYLKSLQEGIRVRSGPDNAVMGDEERQKEIQRVQKQVSDACK
ncbi:MAG: hypothetical protein LW849_10105 [Burkholderiales bacterium]|jgi:hypothetical protein|nr:hypothetical protein [Burkholderiales bacterium]